MVRSQPMKPKTQARAITPNHHSNLLVISSLLDAAQYAGEIG